MKYLKIYEKLEKEYTFEQWLKEYKRNYSFRSDIFCNSTERNFENKITSLKGIEKFKNLTTFNCGRNSLKSLKGIENCQNLVHLICHENILETLEDLKTLEKLETIICTNNKIKSLKGLEGCVELKELKMDSNEVKSLKEVEDLPKLKYVSCRENPLEDIPPLLIRTMRYSEAYFRSYNFQKNFLEEHPERVKELQKIGFNDKIKEEYKELIEFFGIKL